MKLKKKQRRIITIVILVIVIFLILYIFNIFNVKNLLNGNSIEKKKTNDSSVTEMKGNNISLPKEFADIGIKILDGDKIIDYVKKEKDDTENIVSEITVKTDKSMDDVFSQYTSIYSNSMTHVSDKTKTIIAGDAENLIKIMISNKEYKISIEIR